MSVRPSILLKSTPLNPFADFLFPCFIFQLRAEHQLFSFLGKKKKNKVINHNNKIKKLHCDNQVQRRSEDSGEWNLKNAAFKRNKAKI